MPYRRRYRRRNRRARAASTLQAAWRRKMRRKRGSVNQRQTLANARAIKKLKKMPEVKRSGIFLAGEKTNYYGTILQETFVDNYGMATNTAQWNAIAPGTFLPLPKYQPVALMPILTAQSTKEVGGRIGNDIRMKNLILKITVRGQPSDKNSGIWNGASFRQKVRCMVVLDKDPSPVNTTLTLPSASWAYEPTAMPCQVFDYSPNWNNTLAAGFPSLTSVTQAPQLSDVLYSIYEQTANPPGLASSPAGLCNRDLVDEAFRNTDTLDKKRFKVLRVKDLHVRQLLSEAAANEVTPNSNAVVSHTMVIKHPYTFHFDNDKSLAPSNQRIYVFFFSDVPTQRGNNSTGVIADFVIPPTVQCNARLNYTDS